MITNKKTKKIMKLNTIKYLQNGFLNFAQFKLLMQAIDNNNANPMQDIKQNLDRLSQQ